MQDNDSRSRTSPEERRLFAADPAVVNEIALARAPWRRARATLAAYPEVGAILDDLYEQVLPHFVTGRANSAVHHAAQVVSFMARIAVAELPPPDVKRGVVAALLHDVGFGAPVPPKVTEEMIATAPAAERGRLRRSAIASRCEHMRKGVEISRPLLEAYQGDHPQALSDEDIAVILNVVGTHDNSKIPLLLDSADRKWLLSADDDDWLKQCHWEADALWMLSPAGILVDLQRQKEADTPANRRAKFRYNLSLQRRIVRLYARACPAEEMARFGFRDGLLYRSATGYALAMEFARQAESLR